MAQLDKHVRIKQYRGTEAEFKESTDKLIALEGELVVYLPDETHIKPRLKIGNGTTEVKNLPFLGRGINDLPLSADYNENNPEEDGYIQNRPFYEKPTGKTAIGFDVSMNEFEKTNDKHNYDLLSAPGQIQLQKNMRCSLKIFYEDATSTEIIGECKDEYCTLESELPIARFNNNDYNITLIPTRELYFDNKLRENNNYFTIHIEQINPKAIAIKSLSFNNIPFTEMYVKVVDPKFIDIINNYNEEANNFIDNKALESIIQDQALIDHRLKTVKGSEYISIVDGNNLPIKDLEVKGSTTQLECITHNYIDFSSLDNTKIHDVSITLTSDYKWRLNGFTTNAIDIYSIPISELSQIYSVDSPFTWRYYKNDSVIRVYIINTETNIVEYGSNTESKIEEFYLNSINDNKHELRIMIAENQNFDTMPQPYINAIGFDSGYEISAEYQPPFNIPSFKRPSEITNCILDHINLSNQTVFNQCQLTNTGTVINPNCSIINNHGKNTIINGTLKNNEIFASSILPIDGDLNTYYYFKINQPNPNLAFYVDEYDWNNREVKRIIFSNSDIKYYPNIFDFIRSNGAPVTIESVHAYIKELSIEFRRPMYQFGIINISNTDIVFSNTEVQFQITTEPTEEFFIWNEHPLSTSISLSEQGSLTKKNRIWTYSDTYDLLTFNGEENWELTSIGLYTKCKTTLPSQALKCLNNISLWKSNYASNPSKQTASAIQDYETNHLLLDKTSQSENFIITTDKENAIIFYFFAQNLSLADFKAQLQKQPLIVQLYKDSQYYITLPSSDQILLNSILQTSTSNDLTIYIPNSSSLQANYITGPIIRYKKRKSPQQEHLFVRDDHGYISDYASESSALIPDYIKNDVVSVKLIRTDTNEELASRKCIVRDLYDNGPSGWTDKPDVFYYIIDSDLTYKEIEMSSNAEELFKNVKFMIYYSIDPITDEGKYYGSVYMVMEDYMTEAPTYDIKLYIEGKEVITGYPSPDGIMYQADLTETDPNKLAYIHHNPFIPAEPYTTFTLTGEGNANGITFSDEAYLLLGTSIQNNDYVDIEYEGVLWPKLPAVVSDGSVLINSSALETAETFMFSREPLPPVLISVEIYGTILVMFMFLDRNHFATPSPQSVKFSVYRHKDCLTIPDSSLPAGIADFEESNIHSPHYIKHNPYIIMNDTEFTSIGKDQTLTFIDGSYQCKTYLQDPYLKKAAKIKALNNTTQDPFTISPSDSSVLYRNAPACVYDITITYTINDTSDTLEFALLNSFSYPDESPYYDISAGFGDEIICTDRTQGDIVLVSDNSDYLSIILSTKYNQILSEATLITADIDRGIRTPLYPFLELANTYEYPEKLSSATPYNKYKAVNSVVVESRFNELEGFHAGNKATVAQGGVAIGNNANAQKGVAIGENANATNNIQLGEGSNTNEERSLNVYDKLLLNKDGDIPAERTTSSFLHHIIQDKLQNNMTINEVVKNHEWNIIDNIDRYSANLQFTSTPTTALPLNTVITSNKDVINYYTGIQTIEKDDLFYGYSRYNNLTLTYPTSITSKMYFGFTVTLTDKIKEIWNSLSSYYRPSFNFTVTFMDGTSLQLPPFYSYDIDSQLTTKSFKVVTPIEIQSNNPISDIWMNYKQYFRYNLPESEESPMKISDFIWTDKVLNTNYEYIPTASNLLITTDQINQSDFSAQEKTCLKRMSLLETYRFSDQNFIWYNQTTRETKPLQISYICSNKGYTSNTVPISNGSGGFAAGKDAVATQSIKNREGKLQSITTLQLGKGTNNNDHTLQVFDKQLLDAKGHIPNERMHFDKVATNESLNGITSNAVYNVKTNLDNDIIDVNNDITNIENNTTIIANSSGGFAAGKNAQSTSTGIQLGEGINKTNNTLQIFDKTLIDANGHIPNERMHFDTSAKEESLNGITSDAVYKIEKNISNIYNTAGGFAAGKNAKSTSTGIQLGEGTNTTAKTLQVFNYPLLDKDGKIPEERLHSINLSLVALESLDPTSFGTSYQELGADKCYKCPYSVSTLVDCMRNGVAVYINDTEYLTTNCEYISSLNLLKFYANKIDGKPYNAKDSISASINYNTTAFGIWELKPDFTVILHYDAEHGTNSFNVQPIVQEELITVYDKTTFGSSSQPATCAVIQSAINNAPGIKAPLTTYDATSTDAISGQGVAEALKTVTPGGGSSITISDKFNQTSTATLGQTYSGKAIHEYCSNAYVTQNKFTEDLKKKADTSTVTSLSNTVSQHTKTIEDIKQKKADKSALDDLSGKIDTNTKGISDNQSALKDLSEKVNKNTKDISDNKDALASKADQSALASKADKTALDTLAGKVATNTNNISANKTALASKADKTALDNLSSTVTTINDDASTKGSFAYADAQLKTPVIFVRKDEPTNSTDPTWGPKQSTLKTGMIWIQTKN